MLFRTSSMRASAPGRWHTSPMGALTSERSGLWRTLSRMAMTAVRLSKGIMCAFSLEARCETSRRQWAHHPPVRPSCVAQP